MLGTSTQDLLTGVNNLNQAVVTEGNQTQQAIGDMSNSVTNNINSMSNSVTNSIAQSQAQSQANYDSFTNTTYYDNTVTTIDTSVVGNVQDSQNTQSFLQTIFNTVYNRITTPTRGTSITLPMPHGMNDITLNSSSVAPFYSQRILSNYTVGDLVDLIWYFTFGVWLFSLCRDMYLWFVTGQVTNVGEFANFLSDHNEVIKTYMM